MSNSFKNIIVLSLDILIIVFSFAFALFVRDEFILHTQSYFELVQELPFAIIIYVLVFELFGMYKSIWKYASVEELMRGAVANIIAVSATYLANMAINQAHFNFNLYFIAFFLISSGTIGMRLSYRMMKFYQHSRAHDEMKERTLIIGAGYGGVLMLEEINQNPQFDKKVIGFIDDNETLRGKTIRGISVLGSSAELSAIAYEQKIDTIIIAVPSLGIKETTALLNKAEVTGCKIQLMPPFYEMIGSKESLVKVRDVSILDLLGRDPIVLEEEGIREYIDSKTVLVTGGGGSIGSELCRQLRHFNPSKIVILDIYENNAYDLQMEFNRLYRLNKVKHQPDIIVRVASVRDEKRLDELFEEFKPNVVFHAAAHKHVPLMEDSPKEAIKNNVIGTYNTAKMADKHGVDKFVLISTDKAVNPTNVMGATKRMAEKIVMAFNQQSKTDFAAVRFGNVLGSNGSVIPLFKKQIEEGGPVTVTHPEIIRYFMTIPEACQLVIQAGAYANGGELFVLDMGEQVKILSLAEKLIRLSGYEPHKDIHIEFTGLRPGEKMYEELLVDYNAAIKTTNDKIYVLPNGSTENDHVLEEISNIEKALKQSTNGTAVKLLKQYVDTYKEVL